MTQFKPGDKVRVINTLKAGISPGTILTIRYAYPTSFKSEEYNFTHSNQYYELVPPESKIEFIPGEKCVTPDGIIYIYVGPSIISNYGIFQSLTGGVFQYSWGFLKPYKPPVVHKHWLYWAKDRYGCIFSTTASHSNWKPYNGEILSKTEITYEEK